MRTTRSRSPRIAPLPVHLPVSVPWASTLALTVPPTSIASPTNRPTHARSAMSASSLARIGWRASSAMPPCASTASTAEAVPPLTTPIFSVARANLASRLAPAEDGVAVRSSASAVSPSGTGGSPGISRSPSRRAMRAEPARRPSNFRSQDTSSAMRRLASATMALTRLGPLSSRAAARSMAAITCRVMAAVIRLSAWPAVFQRAPPPREPLWASARRSARQRQAERGGADLPLPLRRDRPGQATDSGRSAATAKPADSALSRETCRASPSGRHRHRPQGHGPSRR